MLTLWTPEDHAGLRLHPIKTMNRECRHGAEQEFRSCSMVWGMMTRFQQWVERKSWTWRRFRQLPVDFQIFAATGVLGSAAAIVAVIVPATVQA